MVKKFIVHLMRGLQVIQHEVNCANAFSAQCICEGIFPDARVLEVTEVC